MNRNWIVFSTLFFYVLSLSGCSTTLMVRPEERPKKIKSEKIWVNTTDQRQFLFTEIRVQNDTLFGVSEAPFPTDFHSAEVVALAYSDIDSIKYRGKAIPDAIFWVVVIGGFIAAGIILFGDQLYPNGF